jgi:hypothetical protein
MYAPQKLIIRIKIKPAVNPKRRDEIFEDSSRSKYNPRKSSNYPFILSLLLCFIVYSFFFLFYSLSPSSVSFIFLFYSFLFDFLLFFYSFSLYNSIFFVVLFSFTSFFILPVLSFLHFLFFIYLLLFLLLRLH